jgi:hypothetical protein
MADFLDEDVTGSRFLRVDQPARVSTGHRDRPEAGAGLAGTRGYRLRSVLLHLLGEEWEHRLYAERDLDTLRPAAGAP